MTEREKKQLQEALNKILDKRTVFAEARLEKLTDEARLNKYGMWDKGYWLGYQSGLDAMYDRILLELDKMEVALEEAPKKEKLDQGFCIDCRHGDWSEEDECCYCNEGSKSEYVDRYNSCEEFDRR